MEFTSPHLRNRSRSMRQQSYEWFRENKTFRGPASDHLLCKNKYKQPTVAFHYIEHSKSHFKKIGEELYHWPIEFKDSVIFTPKVIMPYMAEWTFRKIQLLRKNNFARLFSCMIPDIYRGELMLFKAIQVIFRVFLLFSVSTLNVGHQLFRAEPQSFSAEPTFFPERLIQKCSP